MSMKAILVPMEPHDGMKAALETALLLAQRCGSYIEGFPLRFGISEFVAVDPAGSIPLESYRQESLEEAAQARKLFEIVHAGAQDPALERPVERPVIRLARRRAGGRRLRRQLRPRVRYHRAQPARRQHHRPAQPRDRVRAVRKRPADPAVAAGRRRSRSPPTSWSIGIAAPSRRAPPRFAMPLLHQASRVTVLNVIGGQAVPGPSAEQLLKHLLLNGIPAKLMTVGLEGRSTGEAILRAAAAEGCDLLVKGAFTQSRLRQMIFGGATSHILAHAELPVLMAH